MPLTLTVPVATGSIPKEVETNPKKARVWVESLPLTKSVEAASVLLKSLEVLNRGKLAGEERVALIEAYRPVLNVVFDELDAVYAGASVPLSEKPAQALQLAQALASECAIAYKFLILEKTGKLIGFGNKKSLPGPIYHTMVLLLAQMVQSYKTYSPIRAGVWQEANSLYLYAEEQGFGADVADTEAQASITDVFYEMVMLSLADPYRLMQRETDSVLSLLRQNRGNVALRTSAEGVDPAKAFVIALDLDAGPRPLVQGNRPAEGAIMRLIDSSKLVERLQQKIKASTASANSAARSRATHDLTDLMGRLCRLWGDPPKRQFRRTPSETGVAVCAGIKAISYFSELAANEGNDADLDAIREGRTVPLLKIPQDPMSQLIGVEEWVVLNQSANGLRLHRDKGGTVAVTVGECVGIRLMGGRGWNLGVVRWLSILEGNAIEFGVELISPSVYAVTIVPTIGSSGRTMPALLLDSTHPEAPPDTVLCAPEVYADLREFELNDHGELSTVRATMLIERTPRFDLFQFQPS